MDATTEPQADEARLASALALAWSVRGGASAEEKVEAASEAVSSSREFHGRLEVSRS